MFILGDLLMFATTALVLSITCLVILLHVRARDSYTFEFLIVLIPLCLQMCISVFMTYIHQVLSSEQLASHTFHTFALWISLLSIIMTSILLFVMSRYLVGLLPILERQKRVGTRVSLLITSIFLILSLFLIILQSQGDWLVAMNITFAYHFFGGSMLMVIHGITSAIYRRKAIGHEQEMLLVGMSATFLPLIITFPLDLIFFKDHIFKLAYLSFVVYVVFLYLFISGRYFRDYDNPCIDEEISVEVFEQAGLSSRERELIELLVQGKTNREIADQLFISINTVKTHIKNIYSKLDVTNRVQLYSSLRGVMGRKDRK